MVALGRVRLGLKVGDDPDRWAPPVGETKRGIPVSAAAARREEARCLLGSRCASAGPRSGPRREKGERGQAGRGERERNGPSWEVEKKNLFLFIFLAFTQIF